MSLREACELKDESEFKLTPLVPGDPRLKWMRVTDGYDELEEKFGTPDAERFQRILHQLFNSTPTHPHGLPEMDVVALLSMSRLKLSDSSEPKELRHMSTFHDEGFASVMRPFLGERFHLEKQLVVKNGTLVRSTIGLCTQPHNARLAFFDISLKSSEFEVVNGLVSPREGQVFYDLHNSPDDDKELRQIFDKTCIVFSGGYRTMEPPGPKRMAIAFRLYREMVQFAKAEMKRLMTTVEEESRAKPGPAISHCVRYFALSEREKWENERDVYYAAFAESMNTHLSSNCNVDSPKFFRWAARMSSQLLSTVEGIRHACYQITRKHTFTRFPITHAFDPSDPRKFSSPLELFVAFFHQNEVFRCEIVRAITKADSTPSHRSKHPHPDDSSSDDSESESESGSSPLKKTKHTKGKHRLFHK